MLSHNLFVSIYIIITVGLILLLEVVSLTLLVGIGMSVDNRVLVTFCVFMEINYVQHLIVHM